VKGIAKWVRNFETIYCHGLCLTYSLNYWIYTIKKIKTCRTSAADLCQMFLQSSPNRNIVHQYSISSHIQDDSQHIVLQINLFIKNVITIIVVVVLSLPTTVAATSNNNEHVYSQNGSKEQTIYKTDRQTETVIMAARRRLCLVCVIFPFFDIQTLIFQIAERWDIKSIPHERFDLVISSNPPLFQQASSSAKFKLYIIYALCRTAIIRKLFGFWSKRSMSTFSNFPRFWSQDF